MSINRYHPGPPSDHFDGLRFFNPGEPETDRSLLQVARWKLAGGAASWPSTVQVTPNRPEARVAGPRVTMVGHAALLIQAAGLNVLTDPVWSERASPVGFAGPRRVTVPGIAFEDLPPIDAVLISHCHYDHLDIATLRRLQAAHDPLMAMPLGNDAIVRAAVPDARIAAADWHERIAIGDAAGTTLTRANHWSGRGVNDRRMALWSGHLLDSRAGSVWFAGDTGYGDGAIFRDIRARHGAPDVALIPIGAYEPRWFMAAQHVNPTESVRIMQDVGAARALGIHWGTFQLTDEARDAPLLALANALSKARVPPARFTAAQPGHVYDFGTSTWQAEISGDGEADAVSEGMGLRWPLGEQIEFGEALVSEGLVTGGQLGLAIRQSEATGTTVAHSLVWLGAITQRDLMAAMERLGSDRT